MGINKDAFEIGLFMMGLIWRPMPEGNKQFFQIMTTVEPIFIRLGLPQDIPQRILGKQTKKIPQLYDLLLHVQEKINKMNEQIAAPINHLHGREVTSCFKLGMHLGNIAGLSPVLSTMGPLSYDSQFSHLLDEYVNNLQTEAESLGVKKITRDFVNGIKKTVNAKFDREKYIQIAVQSTQLASILGPRLDLKIDNKLKLVARGMLKGIPWIGPAIDALIFGRE